MNLLKALAPLAVGLAIFSPPMHATEATPLRELTTQRARIIVDNDFGGDPDGLFQLAHHLLSPSVEVRGIIGSHHHKGGFYGYPGTADHAVQTANQLLETMGLAGKVPVLKGADDQIAELDNPVPVSTEAVKFIVQEAMREDTTTPLYLVCGAGLTDAASAWLTEPGIARRLRLVWIGGPEYKDAYPPPGKVRMEYNLSIDRVAGQLVFNKSDLPLWQIPRSTYRQALVSCSELEHRMGRANSLSGFLLGRLEDMLKRAKGALGEAYVLGDSPLVLLTALQSSWEVDPSSSRYNEIKAPLIDEKGGYVDNPDGRNIRVYTTLDNRLMFEDLYAKVAGFKPDHEVKSR